MFQAIQIEIELVTFKLPNLKRISELKIHCRRLPTCRLQVSYSAFLGELWTRDAKTMIRLFASVMLLYLLLLSLLSSSSSWMVFRITLCITLPPRRLVGVCMTYSLWLLCLKLTATAAAATGCGSGDDNVRRRANQSSAATASTSGGPGPDRSSASSDDANSWAGEHGVLLMRSAYCLHDRVKPRLGNNLSHSYLIPTELS